VIGSTLPRDKNVLKVRSGFFSAHNFKRSRIVSTARPYRTLIIRGVKLRVASCAASTQTT
jgi:hypothetical protein